MTTSNVVGGVYNPQRTTGGVNGPVPTGDHELVSLEGPGLFLAAEVIKQGGISDITFVILDIDGRNVVNLSYAAAANWGLTQQNPYGLVLLKAGAEKNFTIGFPYPLCFQKSLHLSVTINETGIAQIVANVIHGL